MANINALEFEYFESFADEISSKFNRLQKIVGHPTASGDYHEEILRSVLRNFLSKRFSVKKGFIYNGSGSSNISKQIDLMIIDENSPASYIFQEGDFAIVIPKAVVAVMEIKSILDASAFDKALENIASAKSLVEFPANLVGITFGFDGTEPKSKVLDGWFKREIPTSFKTKEVLAPDAIMFFNYKNLLVRCNNIGRVDPGGKHYHRIGIDDKGELHGIAFQISIILAMIINACEQREFKSTRSLSKSFAFTNLVQAERGGLSLERYGFGEGASQIDPSDIE